MKYLSFALSLFLLSSSVAFTFTLRLVDGKAQFAKYDYHGVPVWDDAEKSRYMSASSTAADSDFTPIYPDTNTLSVAQDIEDDGTARSAGDFRDLLILETQKAFLLEKIAKDRQQLDNLIRVNQTMGLDVSQSTAAIVSDLADLKSRYMKAAQ